ncbi:hypothetical protein [Salinigranum rubrum]
MSNVRCPYSDITDVVGLSSPALSDRVTRLQSERKITTRSKITAPSAARRWRLPIRSVS